MRIANFPAIGTLVTTLPPESDPAYQLASLALTLHKIIKDMSDNEFDFQQVVPSDVSGLFTATEGGLDDYIDRYEEVLQEGASDVVATLPSLIPYISAFLSGGAEGMIALFLKSIFDALVRGKDTRTTEHDSEYGGDVAQVDTASIVTALEGIKAQMDAILTEFNINIIDSRDDGFFHVGPPAD